MEGDSENIDEAVGLTEASTDDLRQLAAMITEGKLVGSVRLSTLAFRGVGHLSPMMAPFDGVDALVLLGVVRAVLAERRRAEQRTLELVWSGSDAGNSYTRYTKIVVPELIDGAQHRITIAGYSFDEGAGVFDKLHEAITSRNVEVRLFLDIHQLWERMRRRLAKDKTKRPRLEPVYQAKKTSPQSFAEEVCSLFRELHWPFDDAALTIYFDPRTAEDWSFASLHAKCIIVDDARVLITSANFTGRGQERNIEVGIVVHDRGYAAALETQWNNLVAAGLVSRG